MTSLQIQYFMKLCETGSFTRCAQELYIAQPAVSKQIAALEKELGFPLFLRSNRGVTRTKGGEMVYRFFRRYIPEFQELTAHARMTMEGKPLKLSIGVLEGLNFIELEQAVTKLREKHPGIDVSVVRLEHDALMQRLSARRLDLVITFDYALTDTEKELQITPLLEESTLFILSRSHPLAKKDPLLPSDLNGCIFCQIRRKTENGPEDYTRQVLRRLQIAPMGYIVVDNVASGMETIILNHSIGLVDERIELMHPESYRMIDSGEKQRIVGVCRKENGNPDVTELLKNLKDLFRDSDPEA